MIIGYTNPGYPVQRTILNVCPQVTYRRVRSYASLLSKVTEKMRISTLSKDLVFTHGGGYGSCDLLHFFNTVAVTPCCKPYITTFETTVPRYSSRGFLFRRAIDSLLSDQCRQLLALSACTKRRQALEMEALGHPELMEKIQVLHPPQRLLCTEEEISRKFETPHPLTFVFVGKAFFRKGGGELLRALVRVRKEFPIELNIIGNVGYRDYMDNPLRDDMQAVQRLLDENKEWIHFYPSLPNAQVLELMQQSDIGLLPTRGDTYGYSVLEMQAAGLPCITTDLRALPEINDDACGWLIPVSKNKNEDADVPTPEAMEAYCQTVEEQLYAIACACASQPELIVQKSLAAHRRVSQHHDPSRYAERLYKIYERALN